MKELEIFIDMAAIMGKYIDQAYVKQIELADAPGGSSTTPESGKSRGIKYLYDVPARDEHQTVDLKPYADVFPFEIQRLKKSFEQQAEKIQKALEQGELGEEYKNLPTYLRNMADVYASKITEPDELYNKWLAVLMQMTKLVEDGCPLMLVPQATASVAGEANKVDMELRMGFITKEARELAQSLQSFRSIAQKIIDEQRPFLDAEHSIPEVMVNYQPFAFGPNIYWATRGEAGEEKILTHTNAVVDVASTTAFPLLQKIFAESIDTQRFERATILNTALHELAHTLAPKNDDLVRERTGETNESKIAEELKADTGDMKLTLELAQENSGEAIDYSGQLMAKLGDICDYLKNKSSDNGTSGERYYYDGLAIVARLLEKGIMVKKENAYTLATDSLEAIRTIAEINDELTEMYLTKSPEVLYQYIRTIKAKKETPYIKEFLEVLRAS